MKPRSLFRIEFYNCVPCAIETSAPTRIDLAGGTIDIWPLYLFHPGPRPSTPRSVSRARAPIDPGPTA